MLGLMQPQPLLVSSHDHPPRATTARARSSAAVDGGTHRYTYREVERRARRLARALERLGVRRTTASARWPGTAIGTRALLRRLRHGGGDPHHQPAAVRRADVAYIIDHAEERGAVRRPRASCRWWSDRAASSPSAAPWSCMADRDADAGARRCRPASEAALLRGPAGRGGRGFRLARAGRGRRPARSATPRARPGQPKGVLYSHRSTMLHAYAVNLADVFGLRAIDRVLPVVPMFHVNAWGMPYAAPMAGAALVMPGPAPGRRQPARLLEASG